MEQQRTGSNNQPPGGAGFDPAFIPGLSSPTKAWPGTKKPVEDVTEEVTEAEETTEDAAAVEDTVPEAQEPEDSEEDAEDADEDADDGPVFEASDRRARIVVDANGVRLRLDEEECEFRWDEIGAIETESEGRFGKVFTITVHTPDRRWYPIEIEAAAKGRFTEWENQLDDVLDAYFDDGYEDEEADGEYDEDGADGEVHDDSAADADESYDEGDEALAEDEPAEVKPRRDRRKGRKSRKG